MKIARFSTAGEDPRYGIVDDEELVVLAGDPMFSGFDTTGERVALADAKLLAPVIPRSKVVCVGMNYAAHKAELHADTPNNPLIFLKPNTAVVGPGDTIQIPPVDGRIVHEGELAIVIGKIAKLVSAADWADYVFGFTIANDISARDVMFADGQWARAKGYDTFCPIGPWIETELDISNLEIQTFVDGEPRRHGNTGDMLYTVPEIIEFAS
ncbi:MAG TPA: fumarylacetoacetate hydrolase family protein, partial [Terrimesophilobacter sp.]|nr:fumarylacetoacetate hydrolase family protein [Terrimesophilobacter sp.]